MLRIPPLFVGRDFAVKRKYITFASVKEQTKISVLASVLLAVFLPAGNNSSRWLSRLWNEKEKVPFH